MTDFEPAPSPVTATNVMNRASESPHVHDLILEDAVRVKERYRNTVEKGRAVSHELKAIGDFVAEVKMSIFAHGKEQTVLDDERKRIVDLGKKAGFNTDLFEEVIFKSRVVEKEGEVVKNTVPGGLISQGQETLGRIAPTEKNQRDVGVLVVDCVQRLLMESIDQVKPQAGDQSGVSTAKSLSSRELEIMRDVHNMRFAYGNKVEVETNAGPVLVSRRDLFAQWLDTFIMDMANMQDRIVEGSLANHQTAVYDSYRWVKDISQSVQAGEITNIFPTPYTRSVKEAMDVAYQKRNGLLKFILFGDAGVGKTRQIIDFNREKERETVVINFHHFISFDELVGQTSIAVNLGDGNQNEKLNGLCQRFVDSQPTGEVFWTDMQNVFDHLTPQQREHYITVEGMVHNYGKGLSDGKVVDETGELPGREEIMKKFQLRIKAIRDMTVLDMKPEEDMQSRFVKGAILKAIHEGKVVCFDEMDKAGPHAIEGMLSFLSESAGEVWHSQAGDVAIPHWFYITGTSNARGIGNQAVAMEGKGVREGIATEMNKFLADRCEQISINPQPVKDSLMIAGVLLTDDDGILQINQEDQYKLIAALSYIMPALQNEKLPVAYTNRVINSICSRLVRREVVSLGNGIVSRYERTQLSVKDAVELSLKTMKEISLGNEGKAKVDKVIQQYASLLGEDKLSQYGKGRAFFIEGPEAKYTAVSKIWDQPLFQAIASMESDPLRLTDQQVQAINASLMHVDWQTAVDATDRPPARLFGSTNGWQLEASASGVSLIATIGESERKKIVGRKSVATGNFDHASVVARDQLGKAFAVKTVDGGSRTITIMANGTKRFEEADIRIAKGEPTAYIDPLGKLFIVEVDGKIQCGELNGKYNHNVSSSGRILDVSPDGRFFTYRDNEQNRCLLMDVSNLVKPPVGIDLPESWPSARFVGKGVVVGLSETGQIIDDGDHTKLITIS